MIRVVVCADAAPHIGSGHVMRCAAVVQSLRAYGASVELVGAGIPQGAARMLAAIGATVTPTAAVPAAEQVIAAARRDDADTRWVMVDGYHYGRDFMQTLLHDGLRVAWIDDLNVLGRFDCDIVVNPTLGAERCVYDTSATTKVLAGGTYALLRDDVRGAAEKSRTRDRRLVIALGGADPRQLTADVVRAVVRAKLEDCQVIAVVGPSNPHRAAIEAAAAVSSSVSVVDDPLDFPSLLAGSSLVIAAAGTMSWELAALGTPAILVAVADNQRRGASAMSEAHAAEVIVAERSEDLSQLPEMVRALWTDATERDALARRARRIIDGRGAGRVARWIARGAEPERIRLRGATADDALQIWRINSEPSVRTCSFDPSPIPLDTHFDWFDRRIASNQSRIYVLERDDELAAQIRYDVVGERSVELSFAVASPFRRLGLGTRLLKETWEMACRDLRVPAVHGLVIRGNEPSIETFRRAGFTEAGIDTRAGRPCVLFERRVA